MNIEISEQKIRSIKARLAAMRERTGEEGEPDEEINFSMWASAEALADPQFSNDTVVSVIYDLFKERAELREMVAHRDAALAEYRHRDEEKHP